MQNQFFSCLLLLLPLFQPTEPSLLSSILCGQSEKPTFCEVFVRCALFVRGRNDWTTFCSALVHSHLLWLKMERFPLLALALALVLSDYWILLMLIYFCLCLSCPFLCGSVFCYCYCFLFSVQAARLKSGAFYSFFVFDAGAAIKTTKIRIDEFHPKHRKQKNKEQTMSQSIYSSEDDEVSLSRRRARLRARLATEPNQSETGPTPWRAAAGRCSRKFLYLD